MKGKFLLLVAFVAICFSAHAQQGAWWSSQSRADHPQPSQQTTAQQQAACIGLSSDAQRPECNPSPQSPSYSDDVPERKGGGFFLGLQYGNVTTDDNGVDENLYGLNIGYRWQAGSIVAIGIEGGFGRDKVKFSGYDYRNPYDGGYCYDDGYYSTCYYGDDASYAYLGVNMRVNFGRRSPVFAIVRLGDIAVSNGDETVSGGYIGAGIGVDFGRHANLNLTYNALVSYDAAYGASASGIAMGALEFRF